MKNAFGNTFTWFWNDPDYVSWRSSKKSNVLHLYAKPGSGKSVLTKKALQRLENERSESNSDAILYYFCNNRRRPDESASNILRAFVHQFLRKQKSLFRHLAEISSALQDWDPTLPGDFEISLESLWDIFTSMIKISRVETFHCFIDGLDECEQKSTTELIGCLSEIMNSNDGPVVKFFISSRRNTDIQDDLSEYSPVSIHLSPESIRGDIEVIVEERLRKLSRRLGYNEVETTKLKERIVKRAEGMFLWVDLAVQEINNIQGLTQISLNTAIEALPMGLAPLYDRIISDIWKECSETEVSLIWRMIWWVLRAARPLSLSELRVAIALEIGDTSFEQCKERMVLNIEYEVQRIPFLEIVDSTERQDDIAQTQQDTSQQQRMFIQTENTYAPTVRLIHQSAKDYLLQYTHRNTAEASLPKLLELGHGYMAGICITLLKLKEFSEGKVMTLAELIEFSGHSLDYENWGEDMYISLVRKAVKDTLQHYSLLGYAAIFWSYHFRVIPTPTDDLLELGWSFLCGSWVNIYHWARIFNFVAALGTNVYGIENHGLSGLHIAAGEGIGSLVETLIKRGEDVNKLDDYGRSPTHMATIRNFTSVAAIINGAQDHCMGNMANSNVKHLTDFTNHDALGQATLNSDHGSMKKLLADGADPNCKSLAPHITKPVFIATWLGDKIAIEILLNAGASLSTKDRFGRLPLDVATYEDTRQFLIEKMGSSGMDLDYKLHQEQARSLFGNNLVDTMRAWWEKYIGCDDCGQRMWSIHFYRKFIFHSIICDGLRSSTNNLHRLLRLR